MFEDSLLESGNRFKAGRRRITTVLSFVVQSLLIGVLIVIPLIYTEALPRQELMTFLVAPPPPPPPPPAAVANVVKAVQSELVNGRLHTPTRIPEKVQMIKEDEPPLMASADGAAGGVVGGVPGGVPGGVVGGVLGGIIGSASAAVPTVVVPQRVKVSQGVSEGMLIHKVTPAYPPLARQARISGVVVLQAVISKSGTIENLTLKQGHPMLSPAAIEAVKQWKYKPYYLNGEPVEVETVITVNFTLAGG
jgi:protein TonB